MNMHAGGNIDDSLGGIIFENLINRAYVLDNEARPMLLVPPLERVL